MKMKLILIILCSFGMFSVSAAQGDVYAFKGNPERAATHWERSLSQIDPQTDTKAFIHAAIRLAGAYQTMGYHYRALAVLTDKLPIVEQCGDNIDKALFYNSLGDLYLSLRKPKDAFAFLRKGFEEAKKTNERETIGNKQLTVQVMLLNNIGNVLVAERNYSGALSVYQQAMERIDHLDAGNSLKPKIQLNLIRLAIETGNALAVADTLDSVMTGIQSLPDTDEKASDLIALSCLIEKIKAGNGKQKTKDRAYQTEDGVQEAGTKLSEKMLTHVAYEALSESLRIAESLEFPRLVSYAYGYLGQLYEQQKQYSEAMKLTRKALFIAQQENQPEILYLWQWQEGRLHKALGDIHQSVKSYQNAIATLNPIRQELFQGFRSEDLFAETVKPVYLGLTELFLSQNLLTDARDTMEMLKTAELENFFADECLSKTEGRKQKVESTSPPHTAIVYPIMLPDYLALLLTLPDGMKQVQVPVTSIELSAAVEKYRQKLQTRTHIRFLYDSRQLYDWLILPIESLLTDRQIDTLIIAPDGALRLIPFSTLHDGKNFLVERYAVGMIPAVSLTDMIADSAGFRRDQAMLIAGLSESCQGFPALPGVKTELQEIRQSMGTAVVLENQNFNIENLTRELTTREYGMMHIATHGVFDKTPEDSFLLTYNGRLTMNDLEFLIGIGRFRKQKTELLTLSACQTALGNERAAMGLAGVSVKAGVKSVIATLWYVDDESTSLTIRDFYRQMLLPNMSKVKAMQNVQKKLIANRRYAHPIYWSPFLVIGNWE